MLLFNVPGSSSVLHKLGVFQTLSHRAEQVFSDPDTLTNEKNHIKKSLGKCGYPDWVFRGNQKHHDERGVALTTPRGATRPG